MTKTPTIDALESEAGIDSLNISNHAKVKLKQRLSYPDDGLLGQAVEFVIRDNKVSTSYIQRKLKIGYNRAARIMEQLEDKGIVTACDEVGKRTITDKGKKSLEVANKIMDVSQQTGMPPDKVLKKAEKAAGITHDANDTPHSSVTKAAIKGDAKDVGGVAGTRLLSFVDRIERLEEEKAALMEDIKEVYAEAKGVGYDVKVMRKLIALRKMDTEKRREQEEILDLYKAAIGML